MGNTLGAPRVTSRVRLKAWS